MAYNRRYIQRNPCKHKEPEKCTNMPKTGANGFCYLHEKEDPLYEDKQKKKAAKSAEKKIKMLNSGNSDNKLVDNAAAIEFNLLQVWFKKAVQELAIRPYCVECNAWIAPFYYRSSVAHVLPKRKDYGFPSVARHPLNKLFLGAACGCHKRYDNTWEQASEMAVWPIAIEIFIAIYPDIDPAEHKNIPDILRPHIPSPEINQHERQASL